MTEPSEDEAIRVVILGGGVAALEAMLALHEIAGGKAKIDLIAPRPDFVFKPMAIDEPFDRRPVPGFDLTDLTHEAGAEFHERAAISVDSDRRRVAFKTGEEMAYDYLIAAMGCKLKWDVAGATTFWPGADGGVVANTIDAVLRGELGSIAFTVPDGPCWPLPAYELSIRTASALEEAGIGGRVSLVTPEVEPLEAFGPDSGTHTRALLDRFGVGLFTGESATRFSDGELKTSTGTEIPADAVVSMPALTGRKMLGMPHDDEGFLRCDEHSRVLGLDRVYAAGDITSFPVKMGGIGTLQADAAAEAIAADAWGHPEPAPFVPVLRGVLLTEEDAITLGGHADGSSVLRARSLWNPLGKVFGRHLTPYLTDLYGSSLASTTELVGKPIEIDLR